MRARQLFIAISAVLTAFLAVETLLEVYQAGDGSSCGSLLRPTVETGQGVRLGWFWDSDKYCSLSLTARMWTVIVLLVLLAVLMIPLVIWKKKSGSGNDPEKSDLGE